MKKNPSIYLGHILDCLSKILTYTSTLDKIGFLQSTIVQDAVIRNFEIIGEATKQLDSDFRLKYPDVEWKKLAGFRDKLIHDYIGVDLWAVWGVVESIVPRLKEQIDAILIIENQLSDED